MDSTEREELDALLQSPGWAIFCAHINAEWGPGGRAYESATETAANNTNDPAALSHLRQIIAARREILKLLKWPDERLKLLKQQVPELVEAGLRLSRRGNL